MAANNIGMSVPGRELLGTGGGSTLQDQVANETDEERRRRLKAMQQDKLLGPSASAPSKALGLSATGATYGSMVGGGGLGAYGRI
jgi:hypothetical protein